MIPILAALLQAGLPLIAGAIQTKGVELVKDKLGVDIGGMLGTEEGRLKLKQLEIDHEDFLQTAVLEMRKSSIAEESLFLQDANSARQREVQIATSASAPWVEKVATPILAATVLALSFFFFYIILFQPAVIPPDKKEVIIYILGILSSIDIQIISYYFGSSLGSKTKDDTIKVMQENIK